MYAFIRGQVALLGNNFLAVDVSGVGYKIFVTNRLLSSAHVGDAVTLYTTMVVKEGELSLYGFLSEQEKSMFERLTGVSGVGPKSALSALSTLSLNEISMAVLASDVKAFSRVNGIGPKTAGRIVLELKDKIDMEDAVGLDVADVDSPSAAPEREAVEALMSLGYQRAEAVQAVAAVRNLADSTEDLTLMALKRLSL